MTDQPATAENRIRLVKLFEFLKAYTDMRFPAQRDIQKQREYLWLDSLPVHSSIEFLGQPKKADSSGDNDAEIVLRISRAKATSCPTPPPSIATWLRLGWKEPAGKALVRESLNVLQKDGTAFIEKFADVEERPPLFREWSRQREQWLRNERPARDALALFQKVYEWWGIHEREGEKIELLVGDGLLRSGTGDGAFCHPVLLQRLDLEFNPDKKTPQFIFRKREQPPSLYLELLRSIPSVNNLQIASCASELKELELSPLGQEDTTGFLRRLIQGLFPKEGYFVGDESPQVKPPMEQTMAAEEESPNEEMTKVTVERKPVIFIRSRHAGLSNFFDLVLEDIASRDFFPSSILRILGFADVEVAEAKVEGTDSTFDFGNEDAEILFSKPANPEQLRIARLLESKNCVLVQGPPGTGKTHTIANLLGHLLAQGKRVLVTAHTAKALRVLREKVVESLQPLCISVLQNDKKSQDELAASTKKVNQRLSDDSQQMTSEATRLWGERKTLLAELKKARKNLLDARLSETREVIYGGNGKRPIDAARRVKEGAGRHDWIPGPVKLGDVMPISTAEIEALYRTNADMSISDERELGAARPEIEHLPLPSDFTEVAKELCDLSALDLSLQEEFWGSAATSASPGDFDTILTDSTKAIEFFSDSAAWRMEAIQAGRDGGHARQAWQSLTEVIESTWQEISKCYLLVFDHGPSLDRGTSTTRADLDCVEEMIKHLETGGSFGWMKKFTKSSWFELLGRAQIKKQPVNRSEVVHLRSLRALLRIEALREDLLYRWEHQMTSQGAPGAIELGDKPEEGCRQFIPKIHDCLDWHANKWQPMERELGRLGFRWAAYLESTEPEVGANAGLRRIRNAVSRLEPILQSRSTLVRKKQLEAQAARWQALIGAPDKDDVTAIRELREAMRNLAPAAYKNSYEEILRLKKLESTFALRRRLIESLDKSAPQWAWAIRNRMGPHGKPETPDDPELAWEWRQFYEELEKRAGVSMEELQRRIEELSGQILKVTAELIDKRTWVNQISQTTHEQQQALGAFVLFHKSLTKAGKGVSDQVHRAAAKRALAVAKDAVPVWIMPLAEVADAFDPRKANFDVVIIDEASQCDPSALFALYLGKKAVIVGDDQQVTPVVIGTEAEETHKLVQAHLEGIPNKDLYHGETSVYDLAVTAFGGGVIRLLEHFRCAPNIIAFSNTLCYGDIKPLRESSAIPLKTHVVPYHVPDGNAQKDNVNQNEAEQIAALICGAAGHPHYAKNEHGAPVTFGVVSLLGDKQALRIDSILRQRMEPAEYQRRKVLCGNSAQFQGDERDVMFLSVVDSTPENPPHVMKQEGPKSMFKKRLNVAASRARNQMWVVHSLNHETDLQPGDYRRRLIEHALDPEAWERELQKNALQTESIFEERVLKLLMQANYHVVPQYQVGAYRIDLVVIGSGKRLAVECDGEQFHGLDKVAADMARQATLERMGWKFARIRGSIFFRDEERALRPVFDRLKELGIAPELKAEAASGTIEEDEAVKQVKLRAQELRAVWRLETEIEKEEQPQVP